MSVKGIVVMTLSWMVRNAVELTWNTRMSSITCCEGQDQLLMWNYSLEENETLKQLQWFYKTNPICYNSESTGFHVSPLYKGRIEHHGIAGILLKNLSSADTGEYTLYPKLEGEQTQTQNVHTIFLTVYETPTYKCKPGITIHSEHVISCSTNSCERPHLSFEWRIFGKTDAVSNESYLIVNSSWNAKVVFCCLNEPNMKCHNGDQFHFCSLTPINSTHEAPNYGDAKFMVILVLLLTVSVLFLAAVIYIAFECWRKRMLCVKKQQNVNEGEEHTTIELEALHSKPMLTDQELHEENWTQRFHFVNKVNVDSSIFKSIRDSQQHFKAKMQALITENKNLKSQLYHLQNSLQLEEREKLKHSSQELTIVPHRETMDNAGTITIHGEG